MKSKSYLRNQELLAIGLQKMLAERQICIEKNLIYARICLEPKIAERITVLGGMLGEW